MSAVSSDARQADADAAGPGLHGFTRALNTFIGRSAEIDELAALLEEYRLVTVTGPGGVGKTRFACEVAQRLAAKFADGVWLVELAGMLDPAQIPAAVMAALGLAEDRGTPAVSTLAAALGRQQALLVLDNCEHVAEAVGQLCGQLLPTADDVRVLATSREPLRIAGETRYRLRPLGLAEPVMAATGADSEAVALFADRARRIDPRFTLSEQTRPTVAGIVRRLDGMPLAIELAAARVESLGLGQLLDGLDDQLRVLTSGDRSAAERHRSLAAAAQWSYRLLSEADRRVFRLLSVFPAGFTLDAAEVIAGAGAREAVLRLVDCSLLVPPHVGADELPRYQMLQTLRAYGLDRQLAAAETGQAAAGLARYALAAATQASADLDEPGREVAGARRLAADDANFSLALAWCLDNDPGCALSLAIALAPWWFRQGRTAAGYSLLEQASAGAAVGSEQWRQAHLWLGLLDPDPLARAGLDHFGVVVNASALTEGSPLLVRALNGRSVCLAHLREYATAAVDSERALAISEKLGWAAGEAMSLLNLAMLGHFLGDNEESLAKLRAATSIDRASLPDSVARECRLFLARALVHAGDYDSALLLGTEVLAWARAAGHQDHIADCLPLLPDVALRTGRLADAASYLRDALEAAARMPYWYRRLECVDLCGHLCARLGRHAEALTLWAVRAGHWQANNLADLPLEAARRDEQITSARQRIGATAADAAQERGATMTLDTAVEFALLALRPDDAPEAPEAAAGTPTLSARERELVAMVAGGRTDAAIASELHISINTVRSHLDRIREKTGCRRRADLTRLALQLGII